MNAFVGRHLVPLEDFFATHGDDYMRIKTSRGGVALKARPTSPHPTPPPLESPGACFPSVSSPVCRVFHGEW